MLQISMGVASGDPPFVLFMWHTRACMDVDPVELVLARLKAEMGLYGFEFYPFKVDFPA